MSREKPTTIVLLDLPFELDEDALEELGPFDRPARQTLSNRCQQNRLVLERYDLGVTSLPGGRRGWHLWWRVHFHAGPATRITDAHFEIEWPEDSVRVHRIFPEEVERPTRAQVTRQPDGSYNIETLPRNGLAQDKSFTLDYRPTIQGTGEGLPGAWWTFKENARSEGVGFQYLLHAVVECEGELPEAELCVQANIQRESDEFRTPLQLQKRLPNLGQMASKADTVLETSLASKPKIGAVDLLWRIISKPVQGGWTLRHELSSPSNHLEIQSVRGASEIVPESQWLSKSRHLFEQLEGLLHNESGGEPAFDYEIVEELAALGEDLWTRLVPKEIQRCLRDFSDAIGSLLIETDEPWIPWELVIPDSGKSPPFLCCNYRMARWYSQETGPRLEFEIRRILGVTPTSVEGHVDLPFARSEKNWLDQWIQKIPGLGGEVLGQPTRSAVESRIQGGLFDLFHFAGHGVHRRKDPDNSQLVLTDRSLKPIHLTENLLRKVSETRPLVVLNACHTGRQEQALTGLGGWSDRWIQRGNCGALVCPQWQIRDRMAGKFSRSLYEKWRGGATLGEAILKTRRELCKANPADPTPLAYSLYGHPNAIVRFGDVPTSQNRSRVEPRFASPGTESPLNRHDQTGEGATTATHRRPLIEKAPLRHPIPLLPNSIAVSLQDDLLQYFAELKYLLLFFEKPWCFFVNSSFRFLDESTSDDVRNGRATRTSLWEDSGSEVRHLNVLLTEDWQELMTHCQPWYYELTRDPSDLAGTHRADSIFESSGVSTQQVLDAIGSVPEEQTENVLGLYLMRMAMRTLIDVLDKCCQEQIPMLWGDAADIKIATRYSKHLLQEHNWDTEHHEAAARLRTMRGDELLKSIFELNIVNIATVPVHKIIEFRRTNKDLLNSFLTMYRSFLAELESDPLSYRQLTLFRSQRIAEELNTINLELLLLRNTNNYRWLDRMSESIFHGAKNGTTIALWNLLASPLLLAGKVGKSLLSAARSDASNPSNQKTKERALLFKSSSGYLWKASQEFSNQKTPP